MKTVMTFYSKTEAEMGAGLLRANGIETNVTGAQEYTSIVTGSGEGHYELKVSPADFQAAGEILASVQDAKPSSAPASGEPNFFGRAVFLAAVGMVAIPIVGNIGSLLNLKKFWDSSKKDGAATAKVAIVLVLQLPSVFILKYFLNSIFA